MVRATLEERLAFARWLIERGRISTADEAVEAIEDGPLWDWWTEWVSEQTAAAMEADRIEEGVERWLSWLEAKRAG